MIDTPGFDDTVRSDTQILTEISRILAFQYESGLKLKGVIFFHRITDIKMGGTSMKTLQICRKICGQDALKNVMLVTTRWNEVEKSVGAQREEELRAHFWKFMLDFGSTMARYHGDKDSAVTIASQLLQKETVILDLQRELVDRGKDLSQTSAGALVNGDIEELKAKYEAELRDLADLKKDLERTKAEMKLQQELDVERRKLIEQQAETTRLQAALQRPIAQEVRQDMDREKRKRPGLTGGGWLPMSIGLLASMFGIPSAATDMFLSWFDDTSIGEWVTDMIGSF